ncbi:MAG: hypothetical protein KF774_03705 [Planctomyces sp.]|nr:hypothetical protein [Planctomyces sp.]
MHDVLKTAALLLALGFTTQGFAIQDVLTAPPADALRAQVDAWLKPRLAADPDLERAVSALWDFGDRMPTPAERSDALLRTLYLADADVRELVEACRLGDRPTSDLREFRALTSHGDDPLFSNNVRAFYARFLSTATLYEEALDIYRQIEPQHVADPAALLFHRAVCEHALLLKDDGLKTLAKLLDHTTGVPNRYRAVGELMQTDLSGLEEKSLGEVARQMSDVRRRLALGRAGERVQRVEDQIIATLDEIIQQKEDEQSGGGGGGGSLQPGQANPQPNSAAPDTYLGGLKGRGLTDRRDIGRKDNWGNLPEKSQAPAKNMIERNFPGHYRLAVEEYLKRLAEREAPPR